MSDEGLDVQLDRQYRLGYEQAWREWARCTTPLLFQPYQKISDDDMSAMERRRLQMIKRGGTADRGE